MRPSRSLALALPGLAAAAFLHRYRRAVEERSASRCDIPALAGRVRIVPTNWGRLSYRFVLGADPGPPLLLVHGWGRSADSVWWRLLAHTRRTVVAVDLPGHGRSTLQTRFSFELAAEAVQMAIEDAGVVRPALVGHSMGGPIALTAVRRSTPHAFTGLIVVASSAFWVRPRHQLKVAAAPYVLGPNSPVTMRRQRGRGNARPRPGPDDRLGIRGPATTPDHGRKRSRVAPFRRPRLDRFSTSPGAVDRHLRRWGDLTCRSKGIGRTAPGSGGGGSL